LNILGITLGHDSSVALIVDGVVHGIMEAERYFRQKRYKLHCLTLEPGRHQSGFQYVDVEDFALFLELVSKTWGHTFDVVAVQNQGRKDEYNNTLALLKHNGFVFSEAFHVDHHLSHAALAYYSSPYADSVVLSYDGMGNDGQTVLFHGTNGVLNYIEQSPLRFGQSYNNLGYILGIQPDVAGSTAGKTMGLSAYGRVRPEWVASARKYVREYVKRPPFDVTSLGNYGKGHQINPVGLEDLPELRSFLKPIKQDFNKGISQTIKNILGQQKYELRLPGPDNELSQDLAQTVQHAWTTEVITLLANHRDISRNLCVVGGCALNGITNYRIEEEGLFQQCHFVPNPTDCGLSAGAALYAYFQSDVQKFTGAKQFFSPYLGTEAFDLTDLPTLKQSYPHHELPPDDTPHVVARLIYANKLIGIIKGKYEIGPRALGNRSILCNPLHSGMRTLLNEKVKHREWYRPFAPVITAENVSQYFTTEVDIPYMSVICHTRPEYREQLPSITHVDGSARVQTIRQDHNPWLHRTLKEFEQLSGMPILLNTSFNPGGEPILNFCRVGLEMLTSSELDLVLIDNTLFCKPGQESLLDA
jgi:carbamoyltransferase